GTIGLDVSKLVSGSLTFWNGTQLAATGTQALTAGYYIATTTIASTFLYASTTAITATTASTTNLILSSAGGTGTRCLQVGADGTVSATSVGCSTSPNTSTWSTTTSQVSGQLINFSNNNTDIVSIG